MDIDERFHPLIEGTSAAILVFDADQILYINPASKILTGRSARELLGRPFLSLVHPQFRARYEGPAALSGGSHDHIQIVKKNGDCRWVELWLQPVLFRGSAATLATAFDVHDLKESDLSRREAEVQLKLVQRAGRTVSWDWRISNDELTVYGLPRNLLTDGAPSLSTTGRAFFNQVRPDDLVVLKHAIRKSLNDRDPLFLEIGVVDPAGEDKWLVLRGQAVVGIDGQTEHLVGVATDVSDRRRAAELLVREQEINFAVLASISDGVLRTDLDGRITDLSAPAETIIGLSLDKARGRLLKDILVFFDPETGEAMEDPMDRCLLDETPSTEGRTCRVQRHDGSEVHLRYNTALMRDHDSAVIGGVLVLKDVQEQKQSERSMVYLATHDPLTDLVNRTDFERRLGNALTEARKARRQDTLLYLDLDGFKLVNDTWGHPAGDKMLKQFASFLKCRFRETDTLGRVGGDKFAVLLESCTISQARELMDKLYKDLKSFRFAWEDTSLSVSLSTGLAGVGPDEENVEKVLAAAEAACYLAKQRGGNRLYEYEPEEVATTERHTRLEVLHQVQDALRDNSFELHAQLIQPLQPEESRSPMYEILVRIQDKNGDLMLPGRFIPVAERHRIVSAIDRWVLTHCFTMLADASTPTLPRCCVNISGHSLGDDRFLEFVLHELSYRGAEPRNLFFEITETATVTNFEKAQRFISVLRDRGCGFVLDDFGSGLSSFAYLRNFPVDYIKIDGQFVRGLCRDSTQRALVESINHVGHVMQIRTIAESVEDADTLTALREMKVDCVQGHHIAHPVPLAELLGQPLREAVPSSV